MNFEPVRAKHPVVKILDSLGDMHILLHACLWVMMYFFFIYIKMPLLGTSFSQTAILVVKDLITIASIFYFITYFVFPVLALKKRFFAMALSLVFIYYFYAGSICLEFLFIFKLIPISGRGYISYGERLLNNGLTGILLFRNAPEVLMDLLYLLSPALIIKLFATLFNVSQRALRLEMENLTLEFAFLKAQINPHFLFNTLNNVYSLALHRSEKTADVVLKLSELMRYTLYDSNTPMIALEKEIQFYKNYITLEQIRHNDTRVTIFSEFSGNYSNLMIAPLVIFPFIENAFKHGINSSVMDSWIKINLKVDPPLLDLYIENSRFPKRSNTPGGIGTQNAKKRLKMQYPDKHILRVEQRDTTYLVNLSIQLTSG